MMQPQVAKDSENEGIILVMGVTGAGKSYFINQLHPNSVKEGDTLEAGKHPEQES